MTNNNLGSLERFAQFLLAIPREDEPALRSQPEWLVFVDAMKKLEYAHQRVVSENYIHMFHRLEGAVTLYDSNDPNDRISTNLTGSTIPSSIKRANVKSLLQHLTCDEVLIRILDYLPCSSLLNVLQTCHRLHTLAYVSAYRRTRNFSVNRFLNSSFSNNLELIPAHSDAWKHMVWTMKLLRAYEQSVGILPNDKPFVRIPLIALPKRVLVSGAGDQEFNGTYFCTGFNGNGFVFSKPRLKQECQLRARNPPDDHVVEESDDEDEVDSGFKYDGDLLRCVIARRYSHDTLLWYMSKEIYRRQEGRVGVVFIFWANMMISSDADEFRYPSQTSLLTGNGGEGWQSFNDSIHPPTVELG